MALNQKMVSRQELTILLAVDNNSHDANLYIVSHSIFNDE
jgi:hypothetical protein